MSERVEPLKATWEKRTSEATEKVKSALRIMLASDEEITFSSVAKKSGVARSFLYKNQEIKAEIEAYRKQTSDVRQQKVEQKKKTSGSRDIVIEAKDRRIKKLEEEIRQLKLELAVLRGQLYDSK